MEKTITNAFFLNEKTILETRRFDDFRILSDEFPKLLFIEILSTTEENSSTLSYMQSRRKKHRRIDHSAHLEWSQLGVFVLAGLHMHSPSKIQREKKYLFIIFFFKWTNQSLFLIYYQMIYEQIIKTLFWIRIWNRYVWKSESELHNRRLIVFDMKFSSEKDFLLSTAF